jgi:hypothetical protein
MRRRDHRNAARHAWPLGLLLVCVSLSTLCGCAATARHEFADDPGVTVRVRLASGGSVSGKLIGMEEGSLIVDHSVPKSPRVTVVRSDGSDIVYVDDAPVGTAVEIRDVDIVVRERLAFFEVADVHVVSKAYFGWGTGIAAVLAFLLVKVLEDV